MTKRATSTPVAAITAAVRLTPFGAVLASKDQTTAVNVAEGWAVLDGRKVQLRTSARSGTQYAVSSKTDVILGALFVYEDGNAQLTPPHVPGRRLLPDGTEVSPGAEAKAAARAEAGAALAAWAAELPEG